MNLNVRLWWAEFWAAKAKREGDEREYYFQLGKAQTTRELMSDADHGEQLIEDDDDARS